MMRRLVPISSLLLLPAIAVAQPVTGLYVGAGIGANIAGTLTATGDTADAHVDTRLGPVGLAALGWGFGNGLRVEIEGSDRSNSINNISTLRLGGDLKSIGNVSGALNTPAVMLNVAYDVPLHGLSLPVQPYIGAGLGYGWLDFGGAGGNEPAILHLSDNNTFRGPATLAFGSGGALAYQAIAGASLPLLPGLQATLEYRFFGTARAAVPETITASATGDAINGAIPSKTVQRGFEVHDNAVLIGLRYTFGAL